VHYALAPLMGVLITMMNAVNSRFSLKAGNLRSIIIVHLVGLLAASIVVAVRRDRSKHDSPPAYLYAGGVVGVGTIFACNVAYANMDASLAVSLSLLGQTIFSLYVDTTGFLGRTRYPLGRGALLGLIMALSGIAVISGFNFKSIAYAPFALLAGMLPAFSFILNAQLAGRIGILRSTRANYVTGLATTTVIAVLVGLSGFTSGVGAMGGFVDAVKEAGPVLALGGGLMGVIMVGMANYVFPRLPALYATLLMFSGQALAGVALDWAARGALDIRTILGTLIVLLGLGLNASMTVRKPAAVTN